MLSVTNASGVVQTSSGFIGNINPIRYRGYYYDTDLGLYYLQSRYYDPEIGRFVNGDNIVPELPDSMQDYNLYAYCADDPVNNEDPTGHDFGDANDVLSNARDFALYGSCNNYMSLIKAAFDANGVYYGRGYSMLGDMENYITDIVYRKLHPTQKRSATSLRISGRGSINNTMVDKINQAVRSVVQGVQSVLGSSTGTKLHYFEITVPEEYDGGPIAMPAPEGDNPYTNQAKEKSYIVIFYT